jgi:hypothetical protein
MLGATLVQRITVPSKCWELLTQWHIVMSQKILSLQKNSAKTSGIAERSNTFSECYQDRTFSVALKQSLCNELITRPEESYRLWCVVVCDLETSRMRNPWPALGRSATKKNGNNVWYTYKNLENKWSSLFHIKFKPKPLRWAKIYHQMPDKDFHKKPETTAWWVQNMCKMCFFYCCLEQHSSHRMSQRLQIFCVIQLLVLSMAINERRWRHYDCSKCWVVVAK